MTTLETQRTAYLKGFNDAAKGKWVSVKDRLPEKDEKVLIFLSDSDDYDNNFSIGFFLKMKDEKPFFEHLHYAVGWDDTTKVTHWMPLPPPPAVD